MSLNIYVVDDDDAVRNSVVRLLSTKKEHCIRGFRSGDEFLASENALEPGVVLLDFNMQGANGMTVLKSLQTAAKSFVVIMLTAHGAVGRAVDAMKAGAHDFIEKPYDGATLMDRLENAFAILQRERGKNVERDAARARLGVLSRREHQVLDCLTEGQSNKQIASTLGISPRTIEIYRANLMMKLKIRSLAGAVRMAFTANLPRTA